MHQRGQGCPGSVCPCLGEREFPRGWGGWVGGYVASVRTGPRLFGVCVPSLCPDDALLCQSKAWHRVLCI